MENGEGVSIPPHSPLTDDLTDELMLLEEVLYLLIPLREELNRAVLECCGGGQSARSVKERRACLEVAHFGIDKRHEHSLAEAVIACFRGLDGSRGVNIAVLGRAISEIAEKPVETVLVELVGEPLCSTAFDSDGFATVLVKGEEHRHALSTSHHSPDFLVGFCVVVNFGCCRFYIDCVVHFALRIRGLFSHNVWSAFLISVAKLYQPSELCKRRIFVFFLL